MAGKLNIRRRNDARRGDGTAPLYAHLYIARERVRINLEIYVTESEWDNESEHFRGRSQRSVDGNLMIDRIRSRMNDILVRSRLDGRPLTKESFLEQYRRGTDSQKFVDYAWRHLKETTPGLQPETVRHHGAALRKLEAYAPDLTIDDISPEWLQAYVRYLRRNHNNSNATIRKNLCVLRTHYYAAMRAGMVKSNAFSAYRVPTAQHRTVYLTEDEFRKLTQLYRSGRLPANERDALRFFIFMALTGMHITDARSLTIQQIFDGEIHYTRVKTNIRVAVPLSRGAELLVEVYRNGRSHGRLIQELPTDQAFNRVIKRVCSKVGIAKPVSAKSARHTFATIFLKKNPGDLPTLSKMLGHTDISTTMVYAHIVKSSRVDGIKKMDDLL